MQFCVSICRGDMCLHVTACRSCCGDADHIEHGSLLFVVLIVDHLSSFTTSHIHLHINTACKTSDTSKFGNDCSCTCWFLFKNKIVSEMCHVEVMIQWCFSAFVCLSGVCLCSFTLLSLSLPLCRILCVLCCVFHSVIVFPLSLLVWLPHYLPLVQHFVLIPTQWIVSLVKGQQHH